LRDKASFKKKFIPRAQTTMQISNSNGNNGVQQFQNNRPPRRPFPKKPFMKKPPVQNATPLPQGELNGSNNHQ
jgi:hypothetical protein